MFSLEILTKKFTIISSHHCFVGPWRTLPCPCPTTLQDSLLLWDALCLWMFPFCTILQSPFFPASELSIACISWQSSFDWYPGNSTFFFCKVSLLVLRPSILAGEGFLHAWFYYLATEISRENGCSESAVSFVLLHPHSSWLHLLLDVSREFSTLGAKTFQLRVRRFMFWRNILAKNMPNCAGVCVSIPYRSAHDSDIFGNVP